MELVSQDSRAAQSSHPGTLQQCSTQANWQSLLLQSYTNPSKVEQLIVPAVPDYQIVLVTAGNCRIETQRRGSWAWAEYRPGDLGMTAPHTENCLRWKSERVHETLHLTLPFKLLSTVHQEIGRCAIPLADLPNLLRQTDPLIAAVMAALQRGLRHGAPELYAQSAAYFLVTHLLSASRPDCQPPHLTAAGGLQRIDEYMQAHLSQALTLDQLAQVAGLSPFQMLRMANAVWKETPMRRLTRLRMELAQRLLKQRDIPVGEIALTCGYSNPSHFATAFRRVTGVSPTVFQRLH
ncbi:helix-turn-helix transcriptional regulator [Deinococcus sp. Arct2-2]|uniref:helix-turn-helix domain-containing protein n=1 Tax=Deinococcus sp. Arct2-2 TaxID=2568653 RepID=UPI0010A3C734|nr:AraC family transcriptional regulator [Deinococcus sp. Arct2-2]THF69568.1 helix-turn-helix transcriptional regulator [Deinococcus sp. Arct2-2]